MQCLEKSDRNKVLLFCRKECTDALRRAMLPQQISAGGHVDTPATARSGNCSCSCACSKTEQTTNCFFNNISLTANGSDSSASSAAVSILGKLRIECEFAVIRGLGASRSHSFRSMVCTARPNGWILPRARQYISQKNSRVADRCGARSDVHALAWVQGKLFNGGQLRNQREICKVEAKGGTRRAIRQFLHRSEL